MADKNTGCVFTAIQYVFLLHIRIILQNQSKIMYFLFIMNRGKKKKKSTFSLMADIPTGVRQFWIRQYGSRLIYSYIQRQ